MKMKTRCVQKAVNGHEKHKKSQEDKGMSFEICGATANNECPLTAFGHTFALAAMCV